METFYRRVSTISLHANTFLAYVRCTACILWEKEGMNEWCISMEVHNVNPTYPSVLRWWCPPFRVIQFPQFYQQSPVWHCLFYSFQLIFVHARPCYSLRRHRLSLLQLPMRKSSKCQNRHQRRDIPRFGNSTSLLNEKRSTANGEWLALWTVRRYLIFEITSVTVNRFLICAGANVVLHHILLLTEISIKLKILRRRCLFGSIWKYRRNVAAAKNWDFISELSSICNDFFFSLLAAI